MWQFLSGVQELIFLCARTKSMMSLDNLNFYVDIPVAIGNKADAIARAFVSHFVCHSND